MTCPQPRRHELGVLHPRINLHDMFAHPLRTNARPNDVSAKLLSRIDQMLRAHAANDKVWAKG